MSRKRILFMIVAAAVCAQLPAFGQTPQGEQRITQSIVINGQPSQGALVVGANGIQSYTCASPQQYTTPDGAMSGWACFEPASGVWLLHALPPQTQAIPPAPAAPLPPPPAPQTTIVYGAPLPAYAPGSVVPAYGYYPYDYYAGYYPYYGYYPYVYPYGYYRYYGGFRYGYGFGYGYRGPVVAPRAVGGVSAARAGGRAGGGRR